MRRSAEQRFRPMKDYAAPPKVKWGSFFSVIQFFMGGFVAFYTGFELAILFSAGVPIVLTNLSSFLVGKMQGGLLSVPLLLSLTLIVLILCISVYFVQFEAMVRSANYRLLRQTQLREALLDRSIEQKRAYHRSF